MQTNKGTDHLAPSANLEKPMTEKHVHKLRRHTYKSGGSIFFCALPDCKYKTTTPLALGKRCICWRCGEPFVMNEYSIRLAKPHCEKCHKPKKESDIVIFKEALGQPETKQSKPFIGNSTSDLRSRLSSLIHGNLAGKPDTDEDI